jgi:hypothetical protein
MMLATLPLGSAETVNTEMMSEMTVRAMEKVFKRSDTAHQASMAKISHGLTVRKAVEVVRRANLSSHPALMQVTQMIQRKSFRKQPQGYSGVDGARKLLNDMIYESMSKYDEEIAKCTEYYSKQCAAMEVCRGQIAASNYIAANSRALILDSEGTVNRCEVDIPTRKLELKQHLLKCEHELTKMRTRLGIVLGDIAVMTTILEMTDCDKTFLQMDKISLLKCRDPCKKTSFITFTHTALKAKVQQLSALGHGIMQSTFADLFEGIEGLQTAEERIDRQMPMVNKTVFNNPPVPRTEVPADPCTDPDAGAPSMKDKRSAKCSITHSPQCYKLQERFLLIQAGIEDERDELQEEISMLEQYCEETKKTLETQIENDQNMLANAQTKLAQATEKEADAGEEARQTASEDEQLNTDLKKQMKTCSDNYINFETEICGLKKIRGELYKLKGSGSAFFQDCEVGKWAPEECTKTCSGGEQKLTRSILTQEDQGAKCLPLEALRSCNNHPCPVDCVLDAWTGWSKCSAPCGGGVRQRLREVKVAMAYGGKPCSTSSQTVSCNGFACEKDCELTDWTAWSSCSKDCDGGTMKREKYIREAAEGEGKCPGEWSPKRLEYKECALFRCKSAQTSAPMPCNSTLDVILLIDGSGSLGKTGWDAEIKAAKAFVGAFKSASEGFIEMAVILFSGPRTWSGVYRCTGRQPSSSSSLEQCGIKQVTHFTDDLNKVDQLITALQWPQGSTLTSLALLTAKAEMTLGRSDIHTVVVVLTDGRPLSYRKTYEASRAVRKMARLLWVPITRYAPLSQIKHWATRRWQENVVLVKNFDDLEKPEVVTHIIADMCPKEPPKSSFERR